MEIDAFSVRNHLGNVVSDRFSSMYPFPVDPGNKLFVEGAVRFEGSPDLRPDAQDFRVSLNISGTLVPMSSDQNGAFHGEVIIPNGSSSISMTPFIDTIGTRWPSSGRTGPYHRPPRGHRRGGYRAPRGRADPDPHPLGLPECSRQDREPRHATIRLRHCFDTDARASNATLRYWRAVMDDTNSDGVPDPSEYSSMTMPLSIGFSGEEQLNFNDIDLSGVPFNSPVYMYLEGTDWSIAGRTSQAAQEVAWASMTPGPTCWWRRTSRPR